MTELLAPAGSMKALKAAISSGCDAIYLATNKFGARAYANNFSMDELQEAISYAHLRDVKIYVTMNTILFEGELDEAKKQIDDLAMMFVDGIIIQDLALVDYIKNKHKNVEVHISTQVGIDDIYGVKLFEDLNVNRIVLSREMPLNEILYIKSKSSMALEVFVHGALCVSYSGNCLMSGLIGYRSGNRGRCVGSCRKEYTLINKTLDKVIDKSYLLSMKDLKTIENIDSLKKIDSLKIEGRMKEPAYVYNVVSAYKKALMSTIESPDLENLEKTFHRTFTKGYIFNENIKDITNIKKPNNHGYYIGYISKIQNNKYEISLIKPLNQYDQIRIDNKFEEVNLKAVKIYNASGNLINKAEKICYIELKEKLNINDKVYISSDYNFLKQFETDIYPEYKRFPLNITISGNIGSPLIIIAKSNDNTIKYTSSFILEKALNKPTSYEIFYKQFNKLSDTVYYLENLTLNIADDVFIVLSSLNQVRRDIISLLDMKKIKKDFHNIEYAKTFDKVPSIANQIKKISCFCNTLEQLKACQDENISTIYYDNVVRRNAAKYKDIKGEVLVGGLNGVKYYQNKNDIVTDFSLNITNSEAVYLLHKLGAKRVTLSHELNKAQIDSLVSSYYNKTSCYPNLEMIVYGKADLLFTKYCMLKKLNLCASCKTSKYSIKDDYESFDLLFSDDCHTTILNSKFLNLIDDVENLEHINTLRLQFTTENYDDTITIIKQLKDKLLNSNTSPCFNSKTDTKGHYNKEIL